MDPWLFLLLWLVSMKVCACRHLLFSVSICLAVPAFLIALPDLLPLINAHFALFIWLFFLLVSTLQINVSSSPTHCQSPPPDYNNYRTSPSTGAIPPPSYAKAISSASPVPEPSNISTHKSSNRTSDTPELPSNSLSGFESSAAQASAFSPIWPSNGTLSRSVKQISLSPPPPNPSSSHPPLPSHQSVKHPSVSFSSRSSSPTVAPPALHQNVSPQLLIPATLPVIPAQNVRSRGGPDKMVQNPHVPHQIADQADEPHSTQIPLSSQKAQAKSSDRSYLSCLETVPLPQLPVIANPAGTLTHASAQPFHSSCQSSQPSYQSTSHFVSLPPPYAAVSELNLSKRTTHYMTSAISHLSKYKSLDKHSHGICVDIQVEAQEKHALIYTPNLKESSMVKETCAEEPDILT